MIAKSRKRQNDYLSPVFTHASGKKYTQIFVPVGEIYALYNLQKYNIDCLNKENAAP